MKQEKKTNEELVVLYRGTKDERYLGELIDQNRGLMYMLVDPFVKSIPKAEYEDLTQEAYIAMMKAIDNFDESRGISFSTVLKTYVRQHLSRLYNAETRQKRFNGSTAASYDELCEIDREGGTEVEGSFSVECKDITAVEFSELLSSLNLNPKETVVVNMLMAGETKGEVAKALKCTPATANYYFKSIRKRLVFAGYAV